MTRPADEWVVQDARDLLAQFDQRLPVEVEAIAAGLGIDVRLEDLDDVVSGLLMLDGRGPLVAINRGHHPNRRRFTIAHEIGHFRLHRQRTRFFLDASPIFFRRDDAPPGNPRMEWEANRFAAELLMPTEAMRSLIEADPIDIFDEIDVRGLADKLAVSSQALTIRLAELGLVTP